MKYLPRCVECGEEMLGEDAYWTRFFPYCSERCKKRAEYRVNLSNAANAGEQKGTEK